MPFQGEVANRDIIPRALPWALLFGPFRAWTDSRYALEGVDGPPFPSGMEAANDRP